jgi:hypothetical protein
MSDYLEPLDRWAATLNASGLFEVMPQALYNSRKLAEGKLNLAIVLIELCNSYDESYEEMLRRSDTLQELDRLIRIFGYTLLDVTILDIRPLASEEMRASLARRGQELNLNTTYEVFKEVLLLKKPDIILSLQCQTKEAESPILKSLYGFTPGIQRPSILRLRGHEALVFRGFHPSTYLRPDYTSDLGELEIERLREGLRLYFRSAFLALQGKRSVRWNSYNTSTKPWSWMYSTIAKRQGLSKEDAEDMSPSDLFESIKLVRFPSPLHIPLLKSCSHKSPKHDQPFSKRSVLIGN